MPIWIRNLVLIIVLPTWLGWMALSIFVYHVLPPFESLLVPSATVTALASPGFFGRLARKVIPKGDDD